MFRRLILSGPSLPALLLSLACIPAFGQTSPAPKPVPWIELKSAHFTVYSDGGEKTAAKVAVQFEQILDVFSKISKNLRVDPGQPIVILAAKDEKSLAALLPEYYLDKNRVHPAGLFIPRTERNYIVLRANLDSDLPFATLYHEYTHQITSLNAAFVPTWFSEGYAEFFGYSKIVGRRVSIGWAPAGDLIFLQQNKLMSLEELFRVDQRSPYYNEGKKVNVFYAQSWALIHMLFMAPEFRESDRLSVYLRNVNQDGDPLDAARRSFGDLNALQKKLESYIRAGSYSHYEMNSPIEEISKSFAVRALSEAETAAVLGTYHISHGETAEGRRLLEQAIKLEPDLVAANEALGMMHVRVREFEAAAPYIDRAVRLNSRSFLTYFYHGNLLMQARTSDPETISAAEVSYTKCLQLNQNFAPAHAALAQIYGRRDETLDKALQSARTAATLEPSSWSHQLALAVVLARRGEFAEARDLANRVATNATQPVEADGAASALTFIADTEQYQAEKRRYDAARAQATQAPYSDDVAAMVRRPGLVDATEPASSTDVASPETPITPAVAAAATIPAPARTYSMIGNIAVIDCNPAPEALLTLQLGPLTMKLHAADLSKVEFLAAGGAAAARAMTCAQLRGISARIQYSLSSGGDYDGEIRSITPTALP